MARTGRPPAPTKLKLLRDDRKDRINHHEPKPSPAPLEPPDWLDDRARAEWDRLAGDLSARAGLSHWDSQVFALYCSSVAKVADAEALIASTGPLVKAPVFDRNGRRTGDRIQPNPALRVWTKSAEIVLRCSSVLGLSPVDRSRITTKPPEETGGSGNPERLLS